MVLKLRRIYAIFFSTRLDPVTTTKPLPLSAFFWCLWPKKAEKERRRKRGRREEKEGKEEKKKKRIKKDKKVKVTQKGG